MILEALSLLLFNLPTSQPLSLLPLLAYSDGVAWLTICKAALMVLMTYKAVNDRLCDKPLDLWGRQRLLRGEGGL